VVGNWVVLAAFVGVGVGVTREFVPISIALDWVVGALKESNIFSYFSNNNIML
jgi:hypothetical protein